MAENERTEGRRDEDPASGGKGTSPGALISGRYRIVELLGEGGMGKVYLAQDVRLERKVAVKLLAAELAADPAHRQRFLSEARAASALNHPNVCIVHEVGEQYEHPFMAMEYVDGASLQARLEDGPLALAAIVDIAVQVADALDAAHAKGIVHRDIKSANICVNERGQVKVLDFGLAKRVALEGSISDDRTTADIQTQPGTILGTPAYMSPEQALGHSVDSRSDLFSVGVVLYELITARLPFRGSTFAEVVERIVHAQPEAMARFNYDVVPELERITRKCLQKNPEERYQSARELLVDLRNLRRELASEEGPAPPSDVTVLAAPVAPATAAPSAAELSESDIFISYAPIDDRSLSSEKQGWISQFHRNLEVRVEQLSGERVKIWRHPSPSESAQLDDGLLEHLPKVRTLVSVISPPFVKSEGCLRQVEAFWDSAVREGTLRLDSGSRIFKVVKRPVEPREMPPRLEELLSELLDFEFYDVDPETGRVREFDESFGQIAVERYHERVYDLAREICRVLRALRDSGTADVNGISGRTVYLATTTSDLESGRDRIRRELVARGHTVLPDRPLPLVETELASTVRELLERCQLSVHPVGSMYGVVPEGSENSILEVQNRLAAERCKAGRLERVIWIPRGLEARDPRQRSWIEELRRSPDAHRGAEIVEDSLENAKAIALQKLARSEEGGGEEASAEGPPRVYLICDPKDIEAVEALEDHLFAQGFEVSLPDFEADEAEAALSHRQNLTDCDAAIIYYGTTRHAWVDIKLRGLLKAAGYGRARKMAVKAVYIAPPVDRRKERFRTHTAEVIRQEGAFDPSVLEALVKRLKQQASS